MANPKINISSLTFDDIKTSLKAFLNDATQNPQFIGYDFSGSALNTLLDVFAYNTLFYSFYSNMIANETFLSTASLENSIVSLVKPLGYLVPGKTSAKIELNVSPSAGTVQVAPYLTAFVAFTPSGNSYLYYSLDQISVASETDLVLYEASSVVNNLEIGVDTAEQKVFLGNTNIDINTLTVKVNEVVWTRHNTTQVDSGSEGNIYFLDRTSAGFYIIFGKRSINDYQSTFGKNIVDTDVVTVSYLIPSGAAANNTNSVINSDFVVNSVTTSSGGTDGADLDLIKFFAPKMFASNDRAVTRDDYYGILLNSDTLPANITSQDQLSIWGGEEADPPTYGRVFVSFADETLIKTTPSVQKCITLLNSKSVVTIIPEYIQSQIITANMNILVSGARTSQITLIQNTINDLYNTTKTFNDSIKIGDIKQTVFGLYPNITSISLNSISLVLSVFGSSVSKNVYFKNEFLPVTSRSSTGSAVYSDSFSYNGSSIILKDKPTIFDSSGFGLEGKLHGYVGSTDIGSLGFVNYTKGYITINADVLPKDIKTSIIVTPRYPDNIIIKNEFILVANTTIST
jgi:hypothetical protein